MNPNKMKIKALASLAVCSYAKEMFIRYEEESEDDDDDFEVILIGLEKEVPTRIQNYIETLRGYSDEEFQRHFRLTRSTFDHLLGLLGPNLSKSPTSGRGRPKIDPEKQLLSTIWILATPDSYRSVGERFDLGKSSLSVSFIRVITELCKISSNVIKWPEGEAVIEVKTEFQKISGIPNVIGVLDGSYIPIKAPKEDPEVYVNRKCSYAITLQAICDSKLKFTDCFVGYPSSVSDARILRNSDIYRNINQGYNNFFPNEEYLLADKIYPVLNWLIPPYKDTGNLNQVKKKFNTTLSKTRQVIERAFSLLKGRFRRLKYLDMNRTDWIPATVLACCVLHNLSLDFEESIENYIREGMEQENVNEEDIDHNQENRIEEQNGILKRDLLAQQLF